MKIHGNKFVFNEHKAWEVQKQDNNSYFEVVPINGDKSKHYPLAMKIIQLQK